jgi:hypothetical protein
VRGKPLGSTHRFNFVINALHRWRDRITVNATMKQFEWILAQSAGSQTIDALNRHSALPSTIWKKVWNKASTKFGILSKKKQRQRRGTRRCQMPDRKAMRSVKNPFRKFLCRCRLARRGNEACMRNSSNFCRHFYPSLHNFSSIFRQDDARVQERLNIFLQIRCAYFFGMLPDGEFSYNWRFMKCLKVCVLAQDMAGLKKWHSL